MSDERLQIDQELLVREWNQTLPTMVNESDSVHVIADPVNSQALLIHIDASGRSKYTLDFVCTYVDSREVHVELQDVEKDGQHVDERSETIQNLIEDYVRHIHETAQALHVVTQV